MTEAVFLDVLKSALKRVDPERSDHFEALQAHWTLDDIGCDSVAIMDVINEVERSLAIQISDESLLEVEGVNDLMRLALTAEASAP